MPKSLTVGRRRRVASTAKRLLVICVGFTICGAGLIMLVLPGPGILVIFLGLVVLSTEYAWAERALERTPALQTPQAASTPRVRHVSVSQCPPLRSSPAAQSSL